MYFQKTAVRSLSLLAFSLGLGHFSANAQIGHPAPNAAAVSTQHQTFSFRVGINCNFQHTSVTTCDQFKDTFFANFADAANKSLYLIRIDDGSAVDLQLQVTDETVDGSTVRYHFIWKSNIADSSGTLPDTPLNLLTTVDNLSTLRSLTLAASQGLTLFANIESINFDATGQWVVVYGKPSADATGAPTGWLDRLSQSPWYVNGAVNGSSSSSGSGAEATTYSTYSGSAELAYIKTKFKLDLIDNVSHTSESVPGYTPGTTLSGGMTTKTLSATGVYSLNTHWSVALINVSTQNPASNIINQNNTQTGIEWTLVPFRTTETKELAFRVGPELSTLSLGSENIRNHLSETYISAFAQIYFYWVTMQDRLSFSSSVGISKNLKYSGNYGGAVSAKASYQVTRFLGFNVSGSYSYQAQSLTFPKNPDYSNPITSSFLSGQSGKSINYTFGATFTLGNSTKKQRDRRWSTN